MSAAVLTRAIATAVASVVLAAAPGDCEPRGGEKVEKTNPKPAVKPAGKIDVLIINTARHTRIRVTVESGDGHVERFPPAGLPPRNHPTWLTPFRADIDYDIGASLKVTAVAEFDDDGTIEGWIYDSRKPGMGTVVHRGPAKFFGAGSMTLTYIRTPA